jgi:hypothetical protein
VIRCEREGAGVGSACFVEAVETAQEICAGGVEEVVVFEFATGAGRFDETQTSLESFTHRHCRRVIQSYNR